MEPAAFANSSRHFGGNEHMEYNTSNLNSQASLERPPARPGTFGPTYQHKFDGARLHSKQEKVCAYMLASSGRFQTLDEIRAALEQKFHERFPTPSLSAFLRHARKREFGSHILEKRRRSPARCGLWEYRLLPPNPSHFAQSELFASGGVR